MVFTAEKLKRLKAAYAKAIRNPLTDIFVFDGNEYVLGYAKYLIEYLEDQMGGKAKADRPVTKKGGADA